MQVRGYAEQKKEQCVGTHSRRRSSAWVHRAEEGAVRGYAARQRFRCVRTVKVRSASEAEGAWVRDAIASVGAWLQ